jgi:LCP family protein required for cell wall assembly
VQPRRVTSRDGARRVSDHARNPHPRSASARRPPRRAGGGDLRADLRRILAAAASAVIPGLGQAVNGRWRIARWLAIPFLGLIVVALAIGLTRSPAGLAAMLVSPQAMSVLLALNVIVLAWRVVAVGHAFLDRAVPGRPGRAGGVGLALILTAVVVPHGIANAWGSSMAASFAHMFAGGGSTGDQVPSDPVSASDGKRINVLIVGLDALPNRTESLTDSLMVASIDPVGRSVSLVSLPRDIVGVPVGGGDTYSPKINSLMSYAERHPEVFPRGGMRTLEDAVGNLLGIHVHYYVEVRFYGFIKLIDTVGGVDVDVKKAWYDPKYDGFELGKTGWGVTAGPHHLNGAEALAYARSRYAPGESDFTRAARQQEILLALRNRILEGGALFTRLPDLFDALSGLLTTDIPTDRLPDLAALADEIEPSSIVRTVIGHPLVKGVNDPTYGSVQKPDLAAILAVAKGLFPDPGSPVTPWPTPKAATPKASAQPAATTTP